VQELCGTICKFSGFVAYARNCLGDLSLAGMTCDRVAMIEVRMRRRIELDHTVFWWPPSIFKLIRPSWPMPSTVPSSRLASFKSGEGAHSLEATEQGRALGRGSRQALVLEKTSCIRPVFKAASCRLYSGRRSIVSLYGLERN